MKSSYALEKTNLILMAIGFAIIILGFTLMIGGDSTDGVSFNPEIFSFQRVTVAPIIAFSNDRLSADFSNSLFHPTINF